jgi:hypothetical protein
MAQPLSGAIFQIADNSPWTGLWRMSLKANLTPHKRQQEVEPQQQAAVVPPPVVVQ